MTTHLVSDGQMVKPVGLQLKNVTMEFAGARGRVTALEGIDLAVEPGEFVSLIGHSGCGKSTLLNIVAGLLHHTSGTVTLDGDPITAPGPDRGVVFQNYSLLPWLTLRDNIVAAIEAVYRQMPRREQLALADEYLHKVGLTQHHDKKPPHVSGGMKQRVAIARAFAIRPKMLLLDEPFGALDVLTKNDLHEELLAMWSGEGSRQTVLMVTHDIDEAIYLSDRIVVMTNGPHATIGEILTVPLARPRDKRTLTQQPAWQQLRDRLTHLLSVTYGKGSRHL